MESTTHKEKYLTVQILGNLRVNCFKNKNKETSKHPDYTGNGVAVWINEKKEKQEGL